MRVFSLFWFGVLLAISAVIACGDGSFGALDPADVSGASAAPCFDCGDMICGYCAPPEPCHEVSGYCFETVRNVSRVCRERPGAPYERCKWRVADSGSCVTRFLNPCIPEHVVCVVPLEECGPKGICIPEGTCPH